MHESFPTIERDIHKEIAEKIATAKEHPLDIEKEADIIQRYADLVHESYISDIETPELRELEARIKLAMAQVATISEFKILMESAGVFTKTVLDTLAHENAHANIADQHPDTHLTHGYGLVYLKDGEDISVQPVHISEKVKGSNTIEFFDHAIAVLEAPALYENKLSDDDTREIEVLKEMKESVIASK